MGTCVSRIAGYGGTWGRGVEIGRQKTLVKVTVQSLPGETASRSMGQRDSDMGKEMPGQRGGPGLPG